MLEMSCHARSAWPAGHVSRQRINMSLPDADAKVARERGHAGCHDIWTAASSCAIDPDSHTQSGRALGLGLGYRALVALPVVEPELARDGGQVGRHQVLVRVQQRGREREDDDHVHALRKRHRVHLSWRPWGSSNALPVCSGDTFPQPGCQMPCSKGWVS